MSYENRENLKDLFAEFFSADKAQKAVEDIRIGEKILGDNTAPAPEKTVIADVKVRIDTVLLRKRADLFKHRLRQVAAVAALFIVVGAVSIIMTFTEHTATKPLQTAGIAVISEVIWESNDVVEDDSDLANLTADIEQVEDELLTVQLDQAGNNETDSLMELETELTEIDNTFWKG